MNSKILIYKLKSNGWLSNQILSLELAVGLAHQTSRDLFLYDKKPFTQLEPIDAVKFGNGFTLENNDWFKNINNLPEYKQSSILDLYESLPINLISYDEIQQSITEKTTCSESKRAAGTFSCFVQDMKNINQSDLNNFSEGRLVLSDTNNDIWRFSNNNNFGYYSRFFYNKNNSLKYCFDSMKILSWVEDLSNKITSKLNNYNACHIRLTDFTYFLPQSSNYNQIIAEVISSVIDNNLPLVIHSDENSSSDFFSHIKNKFKNIIFLTDFCQTECKDLWENIPWINECIVGLVYQNVLSNSKLFLGTPGSTYSGIIHRKWCIKNNSKNLYFIHSGIPGSESTVKNYFENGLFINTKIGPYSWNNITKKHIHNLSWYREWTECII